MIEKETVVNKEVTTKSNDDKSFLGLLEYLGSTDEEKPCTKACSQKEYVQQYIFPTLLPALNKMLTAAKENLVFQKRRSKFNACDFITEYLYNNNPNQMQRDERDLLEIPFVQSIIEKNPRPPLPLSLLWSEEEAALVIQSFWRGHLVRKVPEVQELRLYQKNMREESYHIMFRVKDFWEKHSIDGDGTSVDDGI